MSSFLKVLFIVAALGIPAIFIACDSASGSGAAIRPSNSTPTTAPTATPSDELAASRDLYKTNCAKCHQDSGKGGKVTVDGKNINAHDLTSDKMKKRDDDKL